MNQANNQDSQPQPLSNLRAWIIGLTGVFVVIPALINSGLDVYRLIANIPACSAERINLKKFKEHFGKSPLHEAIVPINTPNGNIDMNLQVYGLGDILALYGLQSQWFASPLISQQANIWFIERALAQDSVETVPREKYYQLDSMEKGYLQRQQFFEDGTKKTFIINPRTGVWSRPTIEQYNQLPENAVLQTPPPTYKLPPIYIKTPNN